MTKVIFIHLLNDFSGSPKVLSQVINACKISDVDVELFTAKSDSGFLSELTENHHHYTYRRSENKWLTLGAFLYSQLVLFIRLFKYRNKDVTFYVNTMLPYGAGLAGFLMRKRVVYHIHEVSLRPPVLKLFLRAIIRLTANKIVFVSNFVKLSEHFAGKKEYVVYNSLSKSFRDGAKINYKSKNGFNVLMLASLKLYKGIEEFVEIARSLEPHKKISFTLVVNASEQECESYFKGKDVSKNIEIYSSQSEVAPFYSKARLVVNLSHTDTWIETFGLTIIEAMAYGIPVIAPPVGGPSEIVTDGLNGYLLDSKKVECIAEKIVELASDQVTWARLSKNALLRSEMFSQESFQKEIINLLND